VLVGAEGVAELDGVPWLREASAAEAAAWRAELEEPRVSAITGEVVPGREDVDQLFTDLMGRPYYLMVVERSAPLDVWQRATGYLRCKRLTE
jgi:hypothetical protein